MDRLWSQYPVACGEALYAPARKSFIPLLVRPSDLLRVNSLEQVMSGLVLVIGAAAGGIVSAFFGPQAAFMLNSASFFAAGLIVCNIAFPPVTKEEVNREDAGIGLFYAALGAGLVTSYALGRLFSRSLLSGGLVCLLLEGFCLWG